MTNKGGAALLGGTISAILVLIVIGVIIWQRSTALPPPPPGVAGVTPEGFAVKGLGTAPITIVEYADFQCANCRRFVEESLPTFDRYIQAGMVRVVFHDFPIFGEESAVAAEASRCALEQNAFWPYHDLLYQRQAGINSGTFSPANLKAFAVELGLNATLFDKCLDSRKYRRSIEQAQANAQSLGLTGTPSFVIQDPVAVRQPITGDPTASQWEDLFVRYLNDFGWPAP